MHIFCELDGDDDNIDEYECSRVNFVPNILFSFTIGGLSSDPVVSSTLSNNRSERRLFRSEFQTSERAREREKVNNELLYRFEENLLCASSRFVKTFSFLIDVNKTCLTSDCI